jgi:integrase
VDISKAIDQANNRLKPLKISIEHRGERLNLQATLPPKPKLDVPATSDIEKATTKWKQQRIGLGLRANLEGVRLAEAKAREISGLLLQNAFDWEPYYKVPEPSVVEPTVAEWVAKLESDYFTRRQRTRQSECTWQSDYYEVYRKLPQEVPLTALIIMAAISSTIPETRTRKRFVQALNILAKFAGLEVNLKGYGDGYNPSKVEIRDLPTDAEVVEIWLTIPNKAWQNFYGIMAAFGLRPHEVWHLDLTEFPDLLVLEETKTGERLTRAVPKDYLEIFNLSSKLELPKLNTKSNRELGERAARQFKRYDIPFPPYNLRHAWCIRGSITYKIPTAIMAKMAGHSVSVHENTYLRHLRDDHIKQIYDQAMLVKQ